MLTMKTANKKPPVFQKYAVYGAAALMLLGVTARVLADPPVSAAPPVQIGAAPGSGDAAPDNTFQWTEVPQDQRVPLTRAVFDQDGYQLFDTAGETVLVPFTNNNLYVMKFAPSDDGTLYLINQGDTPVLYVPQGGYLENATIAGARWYPFPDNFRPAQPVFLGVAPSWNAFASFGWSPGLVVRGGYFSDRSFVRGGVFLPTVGLTFEFGGSRYHDWDSYHAYYAGHPDRFYGGYGDHESRPRVFQGAGSRDYRHSDRSDYHNDYHDHGTRGGHVFRGARGDHRDR
jgi:hypothetical protein